MIPVPRLTRPAERDRSAGLYSAKLLFEFCVFVSGKPGDRRLCEERLILLELDLCHLGAECQPNEVWYAIGERLRPMERRGVLVPRPAQLSAIRNEELA